MTQTIKRLSDKTAQDLCAQQVITSLPDCIKELIDNSIDAGSRYIKIILHDYGKSKIEIIDNGFGINDFDFLGKKGTTSKNKGNNQINFLGFRGEAIHSIGKVSGSMMIESKSAIDGHRRKFNVKTLQLEVFQEERLCHGEFNFQVTNKQNSRSSGTKVTIQKIFEYLPVRKMQLNTKFKHFYAKTNSLIKQFCLIYPEIQFIFIKVNDGKQQNIIQTIAYQNYSKMSWLDRIKDIDDRIGSNLIYIHSDLFEGFVLNKIQSGSSKINSFIKNNCHYIFANRRPIDNISAIGDVLKEIYKKYNSNTHYAYFINLKLDNNKIDVNLTPNKRQIFIRREILEKITKDLRQQIVQKVIQDIPTLSDFQNKKSNTQINNGPQTSSIAQFLKNSNQSEITRKTIYFPITRRQQDKDKSSIPQYSQIKSQQSAHENPSTRLKFNPNFNPNQKNSTNSLQTPKKDIVINKPNKSLADLPQLQKVNVDLNKLKQKLNNRLSMNISSIKRTQNNNQIISIPVSKSHCQNLIPINQEQMQNIRKDNQEKRVRQEEQDAKRRADFLKDVKLQYSQQQHNGKKNNKSQKSHLNSQPFKNVEKKPQQDHRQSQKISKSSIFKPNDSFQNQFQKNSSFYKPNMMQKDIRSRQYQNQEYRVPTQIIKQNDYQQQDVNSFKPKTVQPSNPDLQDRIKRMKEKQNMSMIFTKFQQKNQQPQQHKDQSILKQQYERHSSQLKDKPSHIQVSSQNIYIIEDSLKNDDNISIDVHGNMKKENNIKKEDFKMFQILGQFNKGFILCYYNKQFYLVDQHAACQKANYQMLLNKSKHLQSVKSDERQEITVIQADQIEEYKPLLTESGFYYKIINRKYLELERSPIFYDKRLGLEYFWEIIQHKKELNKIKKFISMCAMKACKSSITIGAVLQRSEMKNIVRKLSELQSPWNCPHGRPTLIQLGNKQSLKNKIPISKFQKRYDL